MKQPASAPYVINSVSEQHRLLSLPKPKHPLVSVFRFEDVTYNNEELSKSFILNFYCIAIKKGFKGKMRYGQHYYDFDEGVMSFISPRQLLSDVTEGNTPVSGWCLVFHEDFIRNYPLAKVIREYGFLSYALSEALHLSEAEEAMVVNIMQNIEQEYAASIDAFSQDVIISHIELLLNYANRFYNRQFITRKHANTELLINLETLLDECLTTGALEERGLPTVQYISGRLNVSANYLSDMLRTLTGQGTQQHIHNRLIEKAKELLTTTSLTVSEIAYRLGFGHPQSFSKLFKNKTDVSPLVFRQSFN